MRYLQRGAAPICLAGFKHGADNWNDVTPAHKREIWQSLDPMQGNRCAYCEAELASAHRHIEHFVQKGRDPTRTFVWSNLFGSCNRQESCGIYKDHQAQAYADADLIKPDVDDPEHWLGSMPTAPSALAAG